MRKSVIYLTLIFGIIFLSSCVTQKKKGDVGTLGKFYHNTTAKYNGYFNADVLLTESVLQLESDHQDNYNQILPLYKIMAHDNPSFKSADLDKAIEKVSVVATLHEPSQWVDDCYVLLGKAQFIKQDYESAQNTFEFFLEEFNPVNIRRKKLANSSTKKSKKKSSKKSSKKRSSKKRKKKKSNSKKKEAAKKEQAEKVDDDTTWGHESVYEEGALWLAKTYIAREKFALAEYQLQKLDNSPLTPKSVKAEIPVVRALSNIDQKKYTIAISELNKAIILEKKKVNRARLIFIASQINHMIGNSEEAYAGFEKVVKMKPGYEMEFNAKLNLAKSGYQAGRETADQAIKKLNKMSKEDKNKEYLGQIYFTLADIKLNNGRQKEGISDLKSSLVYNTNNDAQRIESYYKLASLYYTNEDYVSSKFYYDSTATIMKDNDERFKEVNNYSKNLKEIAENLIVIQETDSLLAISAMTKEEQKALAAKIKRAALEKKIEAEKSAKASVNQLTAKSGAAGALKAGAKPSAFFAYNPQKVRKGEIDFRKRWGSRNLEDNWRRSNRSSSILDEIDERDLEYVDISDEEVRTILKNVPSNPVQLESAHQKIRTALFELGVLFRDRIENYEKSVESLEDLRKRYPSSDKEPDALYYLHLSHKDLGNAGKSQEYFNQLISKYPETTYAQSLTNPDYLKEFQSEESKLISYYNETYEIFQEGRHAQAKLRISEVENLFGKNELSAKFDLIDAMCIGSLEGKEAYEIALKNVITRHNNTPEQARAREILRFLKGDKSAFDAALYEEAKEDFEIQDDKLHYIAIILFSDSEKDLQDSKISISNYNREFHKLKKLNTSHIFLNKSDQTQLILVRKFANKEKAMTYYKEVMKNKADYIKHDFDYNIYAVTQKNYREIIKQRSIDKYNSFFAKEYLGQGK